MEPTWGQHGPTRANLGPTWGQLEPTWANLGPTWGQLRVNLGQLEANMQELGVNLGPTRANMVARGQLEVNMYFGKPEKLVSRFDGRTIFTKLYVSPWTRIGRPWRGLGRSWARRGWTSGEALGTAWMTFLESLAKTLEELPGRAFRIHVEIPNAPSSLGQPPFRYSRAKRPPITR